MKSDLKIPDTHVKKAFVLKRQRTRKPLMAAIIAAVITAIGGVYFIMNPSLSNRTVAAGSTGDRSDTTRITYPLSLFDDGKAHHFTHKAADGLTIRYFILKSADGVVRAAFDACDVCWPENKGYVQDGGAMVCNNCGRRFDSVLINEVQGGCNPAPLERTINKDQLVLMVQDIEQGQRYFNFKGLKKDKEKG